MKREFTGEAQATFNQSLTVLTMYVLLYTQMIIYFTLIFFMLRKYKTILNENFSNPDMSNYRWLIQFFALVVILEIFSLVRNIVRFTGSEKVFEIATVVIIINLLLYISWIVMKSLKNPGIFTGVSSNTQLVKRMLKKDEPLGNQDEGVQLKNEDLIKIEKIKTHMESEKPYLDASLSIYNLAIQVDMSVKDLSVLINHKLNQHFFDFVNRYRIEQAMEMLRDPDKANLTILEILYEVGFNSKSSFNTIFRKYTGTTPTEYRKSQVA
jgi:AraC-like DNA-binding protein